MHSCRVRLRDVHGHTCRYTKSGGTRTGVLRVHERDGRGLDERPMPPTLSKDRPQGGWSWHVDLLVEREQYKKDSKLHVKAKCSVCGFQSQSATTLTRWVNHYGALLPSSAECSPSLVCSARYVGQAQHGSAWDSNVRRIR